MSAKPEIFQVTFFIRFGDLPKFLNGEQVEVCPEVVKKLSETVPTVRIKQPINKLEVTETTVQLKK